MLQVSFSRVDHHRWEIESGGQDQEDYFEELCSIYGSIGILELCKTGHWEKRNFKGIEDAEGSQHELEKWRERI